MATTKKEGGVPTSQEVNVQVYCAFLLRKRLEIQQQMIHLRARLDQIELLITNQGLLIYYFETDDEVGFATAPKKRLGFSTKPDSYPAVKIPEGATLIDDGRYRNFIVGQLIAANAQIEGIAAHLQTIESAGTLGLHTRCYQEADGSVEIEMQPKKEVGKRKRPCSSSKRSK